MSNRSSSDDYDEGRYKQGEKTAKLVTADELRRKVEALKSGKGLDNVDIKLDADEDGNARILGMKISASLAPALRTGLAGLKAFLIKNSDKVFEGTIKVADRLSIQKPTANKVGAVVEDVFRWGLVGADQIYNLGQVSSNFRKQRKALFNEFEPVIQATGANYRNNEVIKAAFEDVHREWVTDMKMMASDLPMMAATAMLAWEGQAAASKRRANSPHKAGDSTVTQAKLRADEAVRHATEQVQIQTEVENQLASLRKDFVTEQVGKVKTTPDAKDILRNRTGKAMTEGELAKFYDENIAPNARRSLWNKPEDDEERYDHKNKKDSKSDTAFVMAVPVLSLAGEVIKSNVEDNAQKRSKHANAWERIKHLKHEVERQCDNQSRSDGSVTCEPKSPDEIMVSALGDKGGADLTLKQYIAEIFQQHERDRNPGKIFKDKKGNVINPLGESLVEQLEGPINQIAEAIASRRIDASALVILVGENKIIKHKGSERHFASKEEVAAAIDALAPVLSTHEKIKPQEFFANFADPSLAEGTLKKTLETLKGDEKALFASLFPHEILELSGLKKKEIAELHKQAHEHLYNFVAVSVLALAETAEKNPDQLKKSGLREEDLRIIAELAEKVRADDIQALQTAVDGHNPVVNAVRTELLNSLASGNGMVSWADRVGKSKNFKLEASPVATSATDREANRRGKETDVVVPAGGPVIMEPNIPDTAKNVNRAPDSSQGPNQQFAHTEIHGRFNQYTSGYWALAIPALMSRYVGRFVLNLLQLSDKISEKTQNKGYGLAVGGWMSFITGLYATRTYGDMKRVFAETLAYEFDKKPEDVGLRDFFKSKNAIVHRTLKNFLKYNTRRAAVSSSFFATFLPWKPFKNPKLDVVDLGVGITGGYLVTDVLSRKITFFEALQNFIDVKINHSENIAHIITDSDLLNLYAIHARDNDPAHQLSSRMDSPAWKKEQIIFGRMADLMNQTYGNSPNASHADFTIPKLVYLLGNGLIKTDNIDQSLQYIEVANRFGMNAVKQVTKEIKEGKSSQDAFAQFSAAFPVQPEGQTVTLDDQARTAHVVRLNEQKQKEATQSEYRFV